MDYLLATAAPVIIAANVAAFRAAKIDNVVTGHLARCTAYGYNPILFRWDPTSIDTDDGLTIIKPDQYTNSDRGRWVYTQPFQGPISVAAPGLGDRTLVEMEAAHDFIRVTGALTGTKNILMPLNLLCGTNRRRVTVFNDTTGLQLLNVGRTGSTPLLSPVLSGCRADFRNEGSEWIPVDPTSIVYKKVIPVDGSGLTAVNVDLAKFPRGSYLSSALVYTSGALSAGLSVRMGTSAGAVDILKAVNANASLGYAVGHDPANDWGSLFNSVGVAPLVADTSLYLQYTRAAAIAAGGEITVVILGASMPRIG